MILCLEIVV